ncbi:translation initiation factor eIF-2A [Cylindrobasidium torrendii FP15055 ss-10]|uniref:Eukaryotic translation initiation factor 2A n=1 Tax=Cylindrobasidium torrendii FP15055 ss-10 TaxID=1314674 RepID=A0A0D7BLJ6_9AGAR|nr:translation initiation factor eIF-2A [Cylindrobasidium torrendii FP15055 ss-10]
MASQISQQYAFRAQKSMGLVGGTPHYLPVPGFESPDVPARSYTYSADGRFFAYALPSAVRIFQAEGAHLLRELPLPNIVELNFSPRGTYLSTWERPAKLEDGTPHKNLRVFSTSTGEELIAFVQKGLEGWDLQYTVSESHAVRLVGADVQVYRPAEWGKGMTDKLRVEGATSLTLSPGLNPSIAVFVAEKKGAPASIKIFGLVNLQSAPSCSKSFYKADRATIKWNTLGTQVLVLTQTDVDNSNKSYYGETMLYLLSAAGNYDCRVTLDKEGPIHDFTWSPNSKEFGVVYGFMPAKSVIFDQRVRKLHDFGSGPVNFISFNPQGRLVALAGFGNLAGKIDMYDRRTLAKITTIDAPNTSYCDWSPDGRFLLTATLSPRLRVDNGVKIWHCSGPLVHIQQTEELYAASWRPTPVEHTPAFGQNVPLSPAPGASVLGMQKPLVVASKPAGAYRPPGARGLAAPAMFKREDEGGMPNGNGGGGGGGSGSVTPTQRYSRSPGPRHVPGAASTSHSPSPGPGGAGGDDKKNRKRNKGAKSEGGGGVGVGGNGNNNNNNNRKAQNGNGRVTAPPSPPPAPPVVAAPEVDEAGDAAAKKVRNLNKKLKAIEELKEKAKRGERLEATQVKKMDGEAEIRRELAALEK